MKYIEKVAVDYLIALLHNHKEHKVVELIKEAQKNNRRSGMSTWIGDEEIDGYSFILKYANSML